MADAIVPNDDDHAWQQRLRAVEQYLRQQAREDVYWRSAIVRLEDAELIGRLLKEHDQDEGSRVECL